MEIYNETMFDLLSTLSSSMKDQQQLSSYASNSLQVIEDDHGNVYVRGLSKHLAQNEEDALNMLFEVELRSATSIWSQLFYPTITRRCGLLLEMLHIVCLSVC